MKTIAAVVVTYNRLADLKICLASLHAQTRPPDAIFVINNGSTDGTTEWLPRQPGLRVVNQPNLGGAGGFATGIHDAHAAGFDGLWCMDDDCIAAPGALAALLNSPELGPAIKNCVSISTRDSAELAFYVDRPNRRFRKVTDMTDCDLIFGVASLFNGTLIDAEIVRVIGVPDRKLFIWGDEVEFMTRALRQGYPVVTITSSIMFHPPAVDREGIPWPAAWKQYYAVRNQRRVFQNIHGRKFGWLIYFQWSVTSTFRQLAEKRAHRFFNFLVYAEATFDSLCNRFGKRPDTILTLNLYRRIHPQAATKN
jgi:rhamnopyranosyl-N-acetylglucosaminyl-diphospho-decaprenol beta-1,3/1,4-galactofuranosyltransferase